MTKKKILEEFETFSLWSKDDSLFRVELNWRFAKILFEDEVEKNLIRTRLFIKFKLSSNKILLVVTLNLIKKFDIMNYEIVILDLII